MRPLMPARIRPSASSASSASQEHKPAKKLEISARSPLRVDCEPVASHGQARSLLADHLRAERARKHAWFRGQLAELAELAAPPVLTIPLDPAGDPCALCPACRGLSFYRPPGGTWTCATCEPPRLPMCPAPSAKLPDPRTAPLRRCAGCGFAAPLNVDGKCAPCTWTARTARDEPTLTGWSFCHLPPDPVGRLLTAGERALVSVVETIEHGELVHDVGDEP